MLGMRMHRRKREIAKDKAQPLPESFLKFFHDRICLTAIRALVVTVFHEGNRGGGRSLDMIAFPTGKRKFGYPFGSHAVTSGLAWKRFQCRENPIGAGIDA